MKNKEIGKLEAITILILSLSIFIYEICFCNFNSITQYGTYNFSLYRIIMYILFVILYKKFGNKFIQEAQKTLKSKKKIIYTYVAITIVYTLYKLFNVYEYYDLFLIVLAELNGLLFILYITKDYIKNIIITTLTLGFVCSISTTVYNVVDEKKHFVSTLNVAVGNFDLKNGLTNEEFNDIEPNMPSAKFAEEYFSKHTQLNMYKISEDEDIYSTPAEYIPLLYLPGSVGINISRLLGGSIADIFYAGRFSTLIIYSILLIIIFKLLPFKKDTFYAIYMLPMSIVLASSYSIDAIITGVIGIFIAYIFKIFNEEKEKINFKTFLMIIGLYIVTLICKNGAYLAVGLIVFILPMIKSIKENPKIKNLMILMIIVALSIGIIQASKIIDIHDTRVEKSNPEKQIEYLLENPTNIVKVYTYFMKICVLNLRFAEDFNKIDFFGKNAVTTSFVLFLFIFYTSLMDNSHSFSKKQKIIQFLSFGATFFIITFVLYISYTEVGNIKINGFQGRYLLPVLPLLMVNISSKKVIPTNEIKEYNTTALIEGIITIINLIFMIGQNI